MIREILVSVLILLGSVFALLAALGVMRFGDVYMRMHAATKVPSFVFLLLLSAAMLWFADLATILVSLFTLVMVFLTAPVASHMISRVAQLMKTPLWKGTRFDDLAEDEEKKPEPSKT